jgi:hypothetical protein
VEPAEQGDGVDRAFGELEPLGLDPGRRVEVVDGGEQTPRIAFKGVRSSWISWRRESAGRSVPNNPVGASAGEAPWATSSSRGLRALPR